MRSIKSLPGGAGCVDEKEQRQDSKDARDESKIKTAQSAKNNDSRRGRLLRLLMCCNYESQKYVDSPQKSETMTTEETDD